MKCWYCRKVEMEKVGDGILQWWKCPECGATHTDVSKPDRFGLTMERDPMLQHSTYKVRRLPMRKGVRK